MTPHYQTAKHIKSVAQKNLPGLASSPNDDKATARRQEWLAKFTPESAPRAKRQREESPAPDSANVKRASAKTVHSKV